MFRKRMQIRSAVPMRKREGIVIAFWLVTIFTRRDCFASESPTLQQSDVPIIEAVVDGRQIRCLVATGTRVSIIDRSMIDITRYRLNQRKKILNSKGRELDVEVIENLELFSGDLSVSLLKVGVADLSELTKSTGVKFDMVLGDDFVKNIVLNFTPERIWVSKDFKQGSDEFDAFPIKYQNDRPLLPLHFQGLGTRQFEIHTGFNLTTKLTKATSERLHELGRARDAGQSRFENIDGTVDNRRVICADVAIGPRAFQNVPAYVDKVNAIGMGLLKHLRISIDSPNQMIYVAKESGKEINWFPRNDSGMMFTFPVSSRLVIVDVIENSPGSQAGLEANDEIVSIEGKSPRDLTFDSLRGFLCQTESPVQIVYSRNGAQHTTELRIPRTYVYPPLWGDSPEKEAKKRFEQLE
ncbi:MAG: PDZ domain-containing protein [Planctomyces sp.]|nr:PDZ domain-containing protein [Planctomyces sp.]